MTSWIDGSFIYSSNEAWISTMRSYSGNGDLNIMTDPESSTTKKTKIPPEKGMPPYNQNRVPLFNHPSPHVMKHQNPERMFGNTIFISFNSKVVNSYLLGYNVHNVHSYICYL